MNGLPETIASFAKTLWHSRRNQDRLHFQSWQEKTLQKWLCKDLPKVGFYAEATNNLQDLPVINKALLMSRFHDFNQYGFTADQTRAAFETGFCIGDLTVGASTGTSGNRGYFVISDLERYRWLGNILAKTMPDLVLQKSRIAILLPQSGALYDSAQTASRITLGFFDLTDGPERWQSKLEQFNPTIIVAPPKILRHMAETGFRLSPARIFAAAETLDPIDRPVIETYFDITLGQIYMATEGLLGVTCRHGRMHLAEESIFFEYDPVGDGLVSPIISSFRRQTQILARYQMNDLLRLSSQPCPCGSPLQAVDEIIGRMDDCFQFETTAGPILITPDILRNAVLNAGREITDFRLTQTASNEVILSLPPSLSPARVNRAQSAVCDLLIARHVTGRVIVRLQPMPLDTTQKLRRVARKYNP